MARPNRSSRSQRPAKRSAFDRKRQQIANEEEKLRQQMAEMQRLLEEAPQREEARRKREQETLVRHAGERVIRLDAVTGTPSAVSGASRRSRRRKTKAQRQAEYAQLFLLAIICAGLVFFAIQLFRQ